MKGVFRNGETLSGKQIQSIHPPFELPQLKDSTKGESIKTCPLKDISKTTYGEPIKVEHIDHIVKQQNLSNISSCAIGQQRDHTKIILMHGTKPNKWEVEVSLESSSQSKHL